MVHRHTSMNGVAQQHVEIIVREVIAETWAEWFAPLQMTSLKDGGTQLAGCLIDQAALHGILNRLRDLNLTILAVRVD
ncbi:MAG: hypothetical protein ACOCX5_05235 [Chloroflexota bacterium]